VGGRTLLGLERTLGRTAGVLLCSTLVTVAAAVAAALLADCPEWLISAAVIQACAAFGVFLLSILVARVAHEPRLEQAAARLGFRPAAMDIPANRRPEHARNGAWNVFRGKWEGLDVRLFEFEYLWETTEHDHRETPLCAAVRVPKGLTAGTAAPREWELPGEWHVRLDGRWLFCWRVTEVDSPEGITELLTTLAGIAERLPEE
jgi:hypothetical protein